MFDKSNKILDKIKKQINDCGMLHWSTKGYFPRSHSEFLHSLEEFGRIRFEEGQETKKDDVGILEQCLELKHDKECLQERVNAYQEKVSKFAAENYESYHKGFKDGKRKFNEHISNAMLESLTYQIEKVTEETVTNSAPNEDCMNLQQNIPIRVKRHIIALFKNSEKNKYSEKYGHMQNVALMGLAQALGYLINEYYSENGQSTYANKIVEKMFESMNERRHHKKQSIIEYYIDTNDCGEAKKPGEWLAQICGSFINKEKIKVKVNDNNSSLGCPCFSKIGCCCDLHKKFTPMQDYFRKFGPINENKKITILSSWKESWSRSDWFGNQCLPEINRIVKIEYTVYDLGSCKETIAKLERDDNGNLIWVTGDGNKFLDNVGFVKRWRYR